MAEEGDGFTFCRGFDGIVRVAAAAAAAPAAVPIEAAPAAAAVPQAEGQEQQQQQQPQPQPQPQEQHHSAIEFGQQNAPPPYSEELAVSKRLAQYSRIAVVTSNNPCC